jgi:hypothetical protein
MRTSLALHRCARGGILFGTLITTAIIGLALAAYLTLTANQNQLIVRSQVWNSALAVAEAGVEEAFTQGNLNYPTNMVSNDWALDGGKYVKANVVGDGGLGGPGRRWGQLRKDYGHFQVSIASNTAYSFTIISTGYFAMPGSDMFVGRSVRIGASNMPIFTASIVLIDKLDMNGNNVLTDSYDSSDTNKSNLGKYDPLKAGDKGDVACIGGVKDAYGVGNANIWGHAYTGPGTIPEVGPNGSVGSVSWQQGGNLGIEPGWWKPDLNMTFPAVKAPYNVGLPPAAGIVGTNTYDYVLGSGNYLSTTLDGNTLVTGNAVIYVTKTVKFGTGESIKILPGASLRIYCGASDAVFGAVDNQNTDPTTFMYFGLPSNSSVQVQGQSMWTGCVYAPKAQFILNGSGAMCGSVVARRGKLNGNAAIHYDESLYKAPYRRGFVMTDWDEL